MDASAQFNRKLEAIFQAEAHEHVRRIHASLSELEGDVASPEGARALELLFRATHSLKGASRAVGRAAMESVCHAMENLLAGVQRGRLAWSRGLADALRDSATALERAIAAGDAGLLALVPGLHALDAGAASAPAPASGASPAPELPARAAEPHGPPQAVMEAHDGTVRIDVQRLGNLLHDVEDLVGLRLDDQQTLQEFDAVLDASGAERERRLRALRAAALRRQGQLAGAVDTLLARIKTALLLPVASLHPFMLATVRELARSEGKDVDLRLEGGDLEMDRRLLEELREPLVHLLRNAIHHGIEAPAVRAAAGKPVKAQIVVSILPQLGGRVLLRVADDGGGIATDRLLQAAREMQVALPEPPSAADLLTLVFGRGISTAARVTHVAGRGIGLAIVRDTVERLGGSIRVASAPGEGTRFTMLLPLSLATFRAVEVRAGGRAFLVPTLQVERCVRVGAQQVQAVGQQQTVSLGEEQLPLASLVALLELPAVAPAAGRLQCLVVSADGRRIALAVEEILAEQEVLSKPVPRELTRTPIVAGAAALGAGRTVPILNAAELVRTAFREGGRASPALVPVTVPTMLRRVLLAEDSITSRTLLKNILELAGYRVDVATDGVQALQRLRDAEYDAVVSDVEMPNLDGIGLTEAIRSDPKLAHLPVVLVTSLGSPADRERGAEAGANAYLVKSSFEQGNLLQALEELL